MRSSSSQLHPYFDTSEVAEADTLLTLLEKSKEVRNPNNAGYEPYEMGIILELQPAGDEGPLTLCCLLNIHKQTAKYAILRCDAEHLDTFIPQQVSSYVAAPEEVLLQKIPNRILKHANSTSKSIERAKLAAVLNI